MNFLKKLINNDYLNLIARIFVGGIFLIAAISKISDPTGFAKEISNYQIMPNFTINFFALILPWIELFSAFLIITGIRIKSSSLIIISLTIIFNIAILIAIAKGLNINCGCHTKVMAELIGWRKIFENTLLLLFTIYLFYSKGLKLTVENYIIKNYILSKISAFKN